jgi:hypothetical protein
MPIAASADRQYDRCELGDTTLRANFPCVMPPLGAGSTPYFLNRIKGVDGRDKPDHDGAVSHRQEPLGLRP